MKLKSNWTILWYHLMILKYYSMMHSQYLFSINDTLEWFWKKYSSLNDNTEQFKDMFLICWEDAHQNAIGLKLTHWLHTKKLLRNCQLQEMSNHTKPFFGKPSMFPLLSPKPMSSRWAAFHNPDNTPSFLKSLFFESMTGHLNNATVKFNVGPITFLSAWRYHNHPHAPHIQQMARGTLRTLLCW